MIKGFIISSIYELDRKHNVELLKQSLPELKEVEAVYPQFQKIPFLNKILNTSKSRTRHELRLGELGCLLSHRKIWRKIVSTEKDETFLITESDSLLINVDVLQSQFDVISKLYDLFFWGAWDGHIKLLKSTINEVGKNIFIGEPFIKTVYCTYGYSLNRRAAVYLLDKTRKVAHPVDQFKKFVDTNDLRIGAILPEVISTINTESTIKGRINNNFLKKIFLFILDCKNNLICYFK
ncbi:MAG: hypothetical protein EPO57_02460 [Chitinophagaceae bacterium]|nr:MAG: hypothetical protein EPO57_02460 [Chitinophagaceae bacterium]